MYVPAGVLCKFFLTKILRLHLEVLRISLGIWREPILGSFTCSKTE